MFLCIQAKFVGGIELDPVNFQGARTRACEKYFRQPVRLYVEIACRFVFCVPANHGRREWLVWIAGGNGIGFRGQERFAVGSVWERVVPPLTTCAKQQTTNRKATGKR